MPSKKVAWIEGEVRADQIVETLAKKIAAAKLPDGVTNKWELVFSAPADTWVTYTRKDKVNSQAKYVHTDGKPYNVYKMNDYTELKSANGVNLVTADGFVEETNGSSANLKTGKKFQVKQITYKDAANNTVTLDVPGLLVALVPDTDPDNEIGKKVVVVEQVKSEKVGETTTYQPDPGWNEFRYVCDMPSDWNYLLDKGDRSAIIYYASYTHTTITCPLFTFTERSYVPDPVHFIEPTFVLKARPDVPTDAPSGTTETDYYVMFRETYDKSESPYQPQYNYFDIMYGEAFMGTNSTGDSKLTYEDACDPATVIPGEVPRIVNMARVEAIYNMLNNTEGTEGATVYVPPTLKWADDIIATNKLSSPVAHYFYGADSVVPWVPNKKRRRDYFVSYFISLNNDRVSIVLEGDPAPDHEAYYRSFAYIGKINSFANYDYNGNFGVTVGMGDLRPDKTGFVLNDIRENQNTDYSGFGPYTSNGMYSFSMMRTRSRVMFQSYYPAFITQLPNFAGVGTVSTDLPSLELEADGYQPSAWTEKYHASPIYLVHQYEGYRGYMDGLVAINDHNLINLDELVVDTEELKDPSNPAAGTWTEVYKFFSIKSPVNFFKRSANPIESTIAILKEVK